MGPLRRARRNSDSVDGVELQGERWSSNSGPANGKKRPSEEELLSGFERLCGLSMRPEVGLSRAG